MIALSEEIKKLRCPDCGNTYTPGAKTCRSCGKTLPQPVLAGPEDPDNLEGMPEKDWRDFIGKNADYYLDVFKKNKNKDPFFKFNWATFFLSYAWFVYRKMYKQAVLLFLISIVLSFVFSAICVAVQLPMIQNAIDDYEPYVQYKSLSGNESEEFEQLSEERQREIRNAYWDYKEVVSDASDMATLISGISSILVNVVVAFMSNWLYRDHILNKTVRKKGYVATSGDGGTALGAALFVYFFGESIMQLIVAAISVLFLLVFAGI